jgi:hypothetical protein
MASTSETGHSKNVANYDELISLIMGFGPDYNPTKESLKVLSMKSTSSLARKAIDAVNNIYPVYSSAVADRDVAFLPLSKLTTRVLNALKATDTSVQVIDNAQTIVRKIQGRRATPKKTEEEKNELKLKGEELKEISVSQMSFNNRLESFAKLVKLLTTIQLYAPNETDLKVSALEILLLELTAKNEAAVTAATPLKNARLSRNIVLYKSKSGLVDNAINAKTYIKSVFGATSPQFKQVANLEFRGIRN